MNNKLNTLQNFCLFLFVTAAVSLFPSLSFAAKGDTENGKKIYMKKCWWCHGKEGEADGPAAKFIIPPPRNFADGVYKMKNSPPSSEIVRDEDIFAAITNGMVGSSMPSWKGILSDQERWDLVAFVKSLTDMFEDMPNPPQIDLSKKIATSPESIEKGKKAFQAAKCFECHGKLGKGNTMKKLKEDSGAKLWPRNFTKAWTFKGGHTPEAIFTRASNGIPNTPMPSFAAEKTGNGKLSEEDRWHVANYVMSLADDRLKIKEGGTVTKGMQVAKMPENESDAAWDAIEGTSYYLVPQIIQKERFFQPANDIVYVKAVFDENQIALLLEWDDRSRSIPGDEVAKAIAFGEMNPDAIAVQTPTELPELSEKPYFGHGDKTHKVSMLYWNSGNMKNPNVAKMLTTTGTGGREESDQNAAGFTVSSSYNEGTWKVMMKRNLTTPNKDKDTQFEVGRYIPIAFANWDGSNGEKGSKHTMTTWYWLLLVPETGNKVVTYPLGVFLLLVAGQFIFSACIRKK